ncbi:MAG: nucleotidyltransferase domain-containing protein [bacterium]|nr:nucleotidyltransferase domain-containing protein [bacterium]
MTKLEKKIIMFLADYPEREFYSQEIADKVRGSKASASGLLKALSRQGVVFKKVKGRMKFYQINLKSPELKRLRIDSAMEKINLFLPKLEKLSQKIILFGSASRGEQTSGSDLDLFILSRDKKEIIEVLKKISAGLRLKPIIKAPGEWSELEITEPEFYREIKNGITLYDYVSRI